MKPRRAWWLLPVFLLLPAARAETNSPLNTAISVSRQFTVFAPGRTLPAAVCVFAERLKRNWLARLELTDAWRDPIVLVIRENTLSNDVSAPINLGIIQAGPIVKYEISSSVPPAIEERALAAVVVRALCLEVANRNRPQGSVTNWQSAVVPLWLAHGLSESIHGRPEWLVPVALRGANSARPAGAMDVLRVATLPDDEASRELFAANAWLLTESLLRLPGGTRKLQRLLGQLPWTKSFEEAFWTVYGESFASEIGLEKWWLMQQARLATIVIPQNLTAAETVRRLDELLTFEEGRRFNALERFAEKTWLRETLPGRITELRKLLAKGHPMYRSALALYIEAAELLVAQKLSRYRRAVQEADRQRGEVDRQMKAINGVLNHAERAYADPAVTNAFQGYFHTLEQAEKFEQQRRNPISDFLDKFE